MWSCHKCGKPVFFAERRQSIGFDWHPYCLRCEECGKVLNPGQHAEHKSSPYCHIPCYAALFGPKLFGHGSTTESHRSFGQRSKSFIRLETELGIKVKEYNRYYFETPRCQLISRDVNDRVIFEGVLKVYWGTECSIRLKEYEDNRLINRHKKALSLGLEFASLKYEVEEDNNSDEDSSLIFPPQLGDLSILFPPQLGNLNGLSGDLQKWETLSTLDKEANMNLDVQLLECLIETKSIKSLSRSQLLQRSQSVRVDADHKSLLSQTVLTPQRHCLNEANEPGDYVEDANDNLVLDGLNITVDSSVVEENTSKNSFVDKLDNSATDDPEHHLAADKSIFKGLDISKSDELCDRNCNPVHNPACDTQHFQSILEPDVMTREVTGNVSDQSFLTTSGDGSITHRRGLDILVNNATVLGSSQQEEENANPVSHIVEHNGPSDVDITETIYNIENLDNLNIRKNLDNLDNKETLVNLNNKEPLDNLNNKEPLDNLNNKEPLDNLDNKENEGVPNRANMTNLPQKDMGIQQDSLNSRSKGGTGLGEKEMVGVRTSGKPSFQMGFYRPRDPPHIQVSPVKSGSETRSLPTECSADDEEVVQLRRGFRVERAEEVGKGGRGPRALRRRRGKKMTRVRRRSSINGHWYDRETAVFTPPKHSAMCVWSSSLQSTSEVLAALLSKYKIESEAANFGLYVVKESGERRLIAETEFPLLLRVNLGPHEDIAKIYLMNKENTNEISHNVAEFLRFSNTELRSFLGMFYEEEEREADRIRYRYQVMKEIILDRLEELGGQQHVQR